MNVCYNCKKPDGHMSKDCPERQYFTRCTHCENVCVRRSSHKIWCQNKEYVSMALKPNQTIQQSTELFSLWCSIDDVCVMDGNIQKLITSSPMFVPNLNLIIMKSDANTIVFLATLDSVKTVELNIYDSSDIDRFRLKVNESNFIVNRSIRIREDGRAEFRHCTPINQRSTDPCLKVRSENQPFVLRISKFGLYEFFVDSHSEPGSEVEAIATDANTIGE